MRLSLTMPVHNEAAYLPYSLASIRRIQPQLHEVIITLDRCTDDSERLIRKWLPSAKLQTLTEHRWQHPTAEAFQQGYDQATGDIILATGADDILDVKMPAIIQDAFNDETLGSLSFRIYNMDLFSVRLRLHGYYVNLLRSMLQHVRKEARHSGLYAFRRAMMRDIGGLADVASEYDEYCIRMRQAGWKVAYEPSTNIVNLRATLTAQKQRYQGTAYYWLPQYNFVKVWLHSLLHLKPHVVAGYLDAKNHSPSI